MGKKALITPRDLLRPAGMAGTLEIEVERRLFTFADPPIVGVEVEVEGLGTAVTDAEGIAKFDLPPRSPGTVRYRARLKGDRWVSSEVEAYVEVVERDTPLFICDLDMTIARSNAFSFVFKSTENVPAIDGAVQALQEIARTMSIVYLTARDHIFNTKSKAWLAKKGFPDGPLYARTVRFWSLKSREHKISRLSELRLLFDNFRWGVGDKRGDAEAYATVSIPAILFSPKPPPGLPSGTRTAASWPDLLDMIKKPD